MTSTTQIDAAIAYVGRDGSVRHAECRTGESVMNTAVREGVPGIIGQCGGMLSCATCHVYVDPADLEAFEDPDEDEIEMLEEYASAEVRENSRLACQLVPRRVGVRRVRVTVPESQA